MSPVVYQGPPCRDCVEERVVPAGPRWRDGRCPRHWYRAAYFGRLDPSPECEPVGVPSVTRFDVLVSAGAAHRAEDPEFEAELERWLGEAA